MIAVGHAATEAERMLEGAVAEVAPWHNRAIHYAPVTGGISNVNWRVAVDGEPHDYFVKIPGRGTEMFIDRAAARPEVRRFIMGRAMARTDRTVEALRALGKPFHSHSGHSVALSHLLMVDFTLGD